MTFIVVVDCERPSHKWTVRVGVFGGVPGDLNRPRAFVAERLDSHDGMLTIGQVDYLAIGGVDPGAASNRQRIVRSLPGHAVSTDDGRVYRRVQSSR